MSTEFVIAHSSTPFGMGARQHFIADEICHTSRSDVLLREAMCYFAKRCVTSRSDVLLRGAMCYFAKRCVTSRSDVLLREAMCYIHRLRGPPSPRNTVIFDQVRKALLRIEILCQHNVGKSNYRRHKKGRVKLHSDHQNAISRQHPP